MNTIIICADDFGLHAAVNHAVLELGGRGRLNATSCLVDAPAFAADAAALRASTLQTGLHLNFTERFGQGGSDAPLTMPLPRLIRQTWLRRLDKERLRWTIARQFDRFEDVMQRAPDFVDGHQHVHQFAQIREALVAELLRRYPDHPTLWLRSTRLLAATGIAFKHRAKARFIESLGARALERKVAGRFRMSRALAGVYDFQGAEVIYQRLLTHWLAAMQAGDVLMCHPVSHIMPADPLGAQRLAEYKVLMTTPINLENSHVHAVQSFE